MENNRFEDSFRNAFDGAEVSPSEGVWTNVELSLEKASAGQLKRNLLLFQLLAAASVVFACGIGALYYLGNQTTKKVFTSEVPGKQERLKAENKSELNKNEQGGLSKKDLSTNSVEPELIENQVSNYNSRKHSAQREAITNNYTFNNGTNDTETAHSAVEPKEDASESYTIERRKLPSLAQTAIPVLVLPLPEKRAEPDPVMLMLARLKDEEKKYQDREEGKSNENMWASLGFGAGSYKPNRQTSNNNASVTGESYSAGVNVAGKISKRIILQGGVSYLSQNADFTSKAPSQNAAMLSEYSVKASSNVSSLAVKNDYVINSNLQFVSIPLQAGYLIVDRTFGIQVNGGIATDLFINNTLSAETGDYQKVNQTAGKDSPYRTVNFSGLLGTELSYRIADHYRISLNPGLRYSLNSIYKEEIAATITPVTFDVSLRFRYIFK